MAKWDFIKDKYPKIAVDASWLEKVDAVLDSLASADVLGPEEEDLRLTVRLLSDFQLAKLYEKARAEKDELDARAKALNLELEAYTKLFADRFADAGEVSKEFDGGMSIGITPDVYVSVEDQAAMLQWVRDKGMEDILTVNYQTLAALVKERLEGKVKEALPEGVRVYIKDKLSCRGRKKGESNG